MDYVSIFAVAVGLSFDTFAVSITCGILRKEIIFWQAVRIALIFAFFQSINPLIGWALGLSVSTYISEYDHWLAFIMLLLLGVKMIYESFKPHEEKTLDPFRLRYQISMGLSTSIDALIIGVSFAFINIETSRMLSATFIIGFVTFVVAMLGMLFGKKTRHLFGSRMELIGGLILIAIGTRILIEHIWLHA